MSDEPTPRFIAYDFGKDGESLVQATLHDDGSMSYEVVWLPTDSEATEEGQQQ